MSQTNQRHIKAEARLLHAVSNGSIKLLYAEKYLRWLALNVCLYTCTLNTERCVWMTVRSSLWTLLTRKLLSIDGVSSLLVSAWTSSQTWPSLTSCGIWRSTYWTSFQRVVKWRTCTSWCSMRATSFHVCTLSSLTLTATGGFYELYVWRSGSVGNVVVRVSEVNRRRARLVLGWVDGWPSAGG